MRSSPAVPAFNRDVLSYVSCIRCRTGQKHKSSFSSDLLQHRRGTGKMGCPEPGLQDVVAAGENPRSLGL